MTNISNKSNDSKNIKTILRNNTVNTMLLKVEIIRN